MKPDVPKSQIWTHGPLREYDWTFGVDGLEVSN